MSKPHEGSVLNCPATFCVVGRLVIAALMGGIITLLLFAGFAK